MDAKRKRTRTGKKPPGRARKMVSIPTDLARRLSAYAGWHGRTESAIVAELLEQKLSGVYLGQRGINEPAPVIEPLGPRLAEAV